MRDSKREQKEMGCSCWWGQPQDASAVALAYAKLARCAGGGWWKDGEEGACLFPTPEMHRWIQKCFTKYRCRAQPAVQQPEIPLWRGMVKVLSLVPVLHSSGNVLGTAKFSTVNAPQEAGRPTALAGWAPAPSPLTLMCTASLNNTAVGVLWIVIRTPEMFQTDAQIYVFHENWAICLRKLLNWTSNL